MKSLALVPYCPWPSDTGTKVEMMKHLDVLLGLGQCTILSARQRPVGFGWTDEASQVLRDKGFKLIFREDCHGMGFKQAVGMVYGAIFKTLCLEKGFGHSNPYHRFAFRPKWLHELTKGFDICVMQYGFWSGFPVQCPKAIVVHELLSNFHWHGKGQETRDFSKADLLLVVGEDEVGELAGRGLKNVLWSPPAVMPMDLPINKEVGLIGTKAPQNLEGLRWLEEAHGQADVKINVFGNMAQSVSSSMFIPVGRYGEQREPYEKCGIHLLTRPDRPGLQIKAVEALAHGRAIIARRGSMRGLPEGEEAWITVDTSQEMVEAAKMLQNNEKKRKDLAECAGTFYKKHLDSQKILSELREAYNSLIRD